MNFWELMIVKDDLIIKFLNKIVTLKNKFNIREQQLLKNNNSKSFLGIGKNLFIILNAPSLSNQNLEVLTGKTLMFVNRGFKHPLYEKLKPQFHLFVDNKLITGVWEISWLDEIVNLSPEVTFVMPVEWAFMPLLQPYIKKGYNFHWLKSGDKLTCLGASGSCFNFAINQKFNNIYFTGFDANGIGHELVKSSNTHFYGVSDDNNLKSTDNYVIDLYMHSRHLRDLSIFAKYCKKKNINIFNLTDGGLLDMFPRRNFNDISAL